MNPFKMQLNIVDIALLPLIYRWVLEYEWTPFAITLPIWLVLSVALNLYGKEKWGWK